MNTTNHLDPLKKLLAFRLFLATLLLGALIIFEFIWAQESAPAPVQLYSFVILIYLLSIFYALRLKKVRLQERFINHQLLIDATLIAALIYLTGGFYSLFFPMFYFIIIGGTIYLERQRTIALLFFCTFLYLLIIFAHFYNPFQELLPLPPLVSSNRKIVSQLFFNLAPFYLASFILGLIAKERHDTKRHLQKVTSDLKEFKDLNEHIIASIDSGLITTDQKLMINSINKAGENILKLEKKSIIDRKLHDILIDLPPAIKSQGRQRYEVSYQQPEGCKLVLGFSLTPLLKKTYNSNPGWIFIFQDLTELKEIEEHLQAASKMAAIGRLSAGIAHEIRNPLAAISGSIEILAKDLPSKDKTHQRLLQVVLKESARLNNLITDFLGFSRLEGKKQINTDVITLLKDLVFLFRSQFSGIRFIEDYHSDSFTIRANPEQLEQIFWNLFKNALEAVDNCGEIKIISQLVQNGNPSAHPTPQKIASPKITPFNNKQGLIKINICDNGPGIEEDIAQEIFEPFFTTKATGTGLGLYIVFQLTQINNGFIQLGKREDKLGGTCAQLSFPAADSSRQ